MGIDSQHTSTAPTHAQQDSDDIIAIVALPSNTTSQLEAVLIKIYASLDKNEKSSMCFILKLLPIIVLQKICTYSKEPKKEWTELRENQNLPKTYQHLPPLPILSNSFLIKIDLCGIKFAMMIMHPHGFGNVVPWGHNLSAQLQSQNCEFAASGGKKYLAANKNYHQILQNYKLLHNLPAKFEDKGRQPRMPILLLRPPPNAG